jgi:hypothetical protein
MESIGQIDIQIERVVDDLVDLIPDVGNIVMTCGDVLVYPYIIPTYPYERFCRLERYN